MWLDSLNISWNKDNFTKEEIILAKQYIEKYKEILQVDFNSSLEDNEAKIKKFSSNEVISFLLRAIIKMKKNWAKSIDELDTINNLNQTGSAIDDVQNEIKDKIHNHFTPEETKKSQDIYLFDILKEAKTNWYLDLTIDMLISTTPLPNDIKENIQNELYHLANG